MTHRIFSWTTGSIIGPFIKKEKTSGRLGWDRDRFADQILGFVHDKFGASNSNTNGDITKTIGYLYLWFREVNSMERIYKNGVGQLEWY